MSVFVLDKRKKPLAPCSEKRARLLLERKKAIVHKRFPFTIRLKDRVGGEKQPIRIKLDPGYSVTGVAIVREKGKIQHVLHLSEITHRGHIIHKHMQQRANFRKRRRSTNLRYRASRFNNRTKPNGWLPPSSKSRLDNIVNWIKKYRTICNISSMSIEHVKFDMQKVEYPEISGAEYQQGTLAGYELRQYLLEKLSRKCAYCNIKNVPLQIEHILAKAKGGSNRVSNLALACQKCNEKKGSKPIEEFLATKPDVLKKILSQTKKSLAPAAAVNSIRNVLVKAMIGFGLPIDLGTGGQTKWNRSRLGIPKTHCLDAACVGEFNNLSGCDIPALSIKSCGRGLYRRTRIAPTGFPKGYLMRQKSIFGFQTGDIVRANIPVGKKRPGKFFGKITIRKTGIFDIKTSQGLIAGVGWKYCILFSRADGYSYSFERNRL